MRFILLAWTRWRLQTALDEVRQFQAQFDVGPVYLVSTMQHINFLRARVKALSN